jgi:hypothetical protein
MIVLALLEIPERAAADAIIDAADAGVLVRARLRAAAQRILEQQPGAVRVRWAVLARQDHKEQARVRARERETIPSP